MAQQYNPPLGRRLKSAVFQYLPGTTGARHTRNRRWARWRETEAAFEAAQAATEGMVAIDLGANIGEFSRKLAQTSSQVIAFEPDPYTADILRNNLADLNNVEVIEAGAGATAGTFKIYRHKNYQDNPEGLSQSTTLISDSPDIDGSASAAEVTVVDFMAFLVERDLRPGIVKIDIEGAEIALLNAIFDHPERTRIGYIFCETHEVNFPKLRSEFKALRQRAESITDIHINLDWH